MNKGRDGKIKFQHEWRSVQIFWGKVSVNQKRLQSSNRTVNQRTSTRSCSNSRPVVGYITGIWKFSEIK